MLTDCPASGETVSAAVARASTALAADPGLAQRVAEQILQVVPADPRALLILGSARRRLGDPAAARALLEPLAKAHAGAAHTHYELGLVLAALGEADPAIAALRHAVGLRRDLAEAWRALGDQLFRQGDTAGAEAAFAEQARASVQDRALTPAADALFDGRLDAAEDLLHRHLAQRPADVTALHMLAETCIRLGRDGQAEPLLARCVALDPDFDGARFSYATVLFRQQKGAEAIAHVERLLAGDANEPAYLNLLAGALGLVGEHDRAIGLYEALLADYGRQPKIWLNYGHALRTVGRADEAVTAYKRCIALAPGLGEAHWSLANLKVRPISAREEAAMEAELARDDLADDDRLHLHYALGKSLEDRGEHAGSFRHYAQGAALRRQALRYDADESHALMRRSKALLTTAFFEDRGGGGSASDEPIFIVGLPRSGSTLIEQILASHSAVEGTMELPDIAFIARDLAPSHPQGYPEVLAGLDASALTTLGDGFIERTRIHRRLGRAFFIDKMPNNFHHIGLIQLILPKARIIDARRHPMAACLSAFKQHFAHGHAYSYDLGDLGRYYRDYVELMDHFDEVLPGRICRVIYEDLVEDTEAQVRRLLDHCGLPFEDGCLRFYENRRAVRTVSSEQVRRPIFRDGLDLWRRYEDQLGPLKAALGPALDGWRGTKA
jgi:tetratricopeptide (TPR) repeat protein